MAPVTSATSRAQTNFVKQIRKASQTWAGGVFLGELKQSVDLVRHPLKSFSDAFSSLGKEMSGLRGKVARFPPGERLKAYGDAWLTWSFGVKPTISDLNAATKLFNQTVSGPCFDMKRIIGTGSASEATASVKTCTMNPSGFPGPMAFYNYVDKSSMSVRYIGGYRSGNPSESMPIFRDAGLDISSFIPTLFEVAPWSFMLDYVTNCGDVLDAYSARLIELAWCCQTTRLQRTRQASPVWPPRNTSNATYVAWGGGGSSVSTYVTRRSHDNEWAPAFLFKIPGFLGSRGLNIAALAAQSRRLTSMRW